MFWKMFSEEFPLALYLCHCSGDVLDWFLEFLCSATQSYVEWADRCGVLGGPLCSQLILYCFSHWISTHFCDAAFEMMYGSNPWFCSGVYWNVVS